MTHQQPVSTRRRAARYTAAKPTISSLDRAVRKGAIRSRPRLYSTPMDDIELARSKVAADNVGVAIGRDGFNDLRSVANVQKLSMLQEIFPDILMEVMEDVLIAAQFRMDIAASMLGEVSRELRKSDDAPDLVFVDWAAVQNPSDMDDDDHWHEVSASRPEMQQWVMVQDDWEVVEGDVASHETSRTFADVLRNSDGSCAPPAMLPPLARINVSASLTPLVRQTKVEDDMDYCDADELSIKSFGARKRRYSKKFRPHC